MQLGVGLQMSTFYEFYAVLVSLEEHLWLRVWHHLQHNSCRESATCVKILHCNSFTCTASMIIPSLEESYDFLAENLASGPKNQTAKMRIICHENNVKEDKPVAVLFSRANFQVERRQIARRILLTSLVEFEVCTISLASVSLRSHNI